LPDAIIPFIFQPARKMADSISAGCLISSGSFPGGAGARVRYDLPKGQEKGHIIFGSSLGSRTAHGLHPADSTWLRG
jgi:hypothetical protein